MEIINLNKHVINVIVGGENIAIQPSGTVATVSVKSVQVGEVSGIPLFQSNYGAIQNLPEPQEGVLYLVNMLVGASAAAEGRTDVIGPDSGPSAIRYPDGHPQKGQIEAVTQFVKY